MARDTRFTKDEVRYLYRAFKQECPNGIVDEETFKDVYEKIFPLGDASHYAHLVFAAIDRRVIFFIFRPHIFPVGSNYARFLTIFID